MILLHLYVYIIIIFIFQEEQVHKMGNEIKRLETFQTDHHHQESMLKQELENLHNEKVSITEDTSRRLAILQNQITYKNQEIDHLQEENRKLKDVRFENSTSQTNKIAELQTLLSRHNQNISNMDHELEKINKEKIRMSSLITTLQKEVSAKELLLKKSKTETEKYRVECRNKEMDISSLTSKVRNTLSNFKSI